MLFGLPTIWLLITVVFVMVHLAPGDPLSFITGEGDISSEQLARLRAEYGLDRPLPTQYALYLKKIVTGDLGFSYRYRAPVTELIVDRIPATLLLMGPSLALFIGLGVLLGILAARRPNSGIDLVMSGVALVGWSVPVFWLGQLLLIAFALKLGWFPSQGMFNLRAPAQGFGRAIDVAWHLVLPAAALGMRFLALSTRMTRSSMLQVLRLDYMTTARAKGIPEPPDPSRYTNVKDPSTPFEFAFPDLSGNVVSNGDARLRGKVMVPLFSNGSRSRNRSDFGGLHTSYMMPCLRKSSRGKSPA